MEVSNFRKEIGAWLHTTMPSMTIFSSPQGSKVFEGHRKRGSTNQRSNFVQGFGCLGAGAHQ